ncbi:AMP-binding protein [Variovorax sp. dw_308]|uniref:AMP-binding protein n=1 Tax=Variovorax sp. dw_308 TaxID=2721546 RepID=UPI001C441ADC|nr:AMP-binding protein [Variovorax sp. dw_308]
MTSRPWLDSYGTIPTEIDPDIHPSITALAEAAMTRYGGKTAFVSSGQRHSYTEIDAISRNFCAYLQSMGVRKGDRVGVMLPNVVAFPVAMLGIMRAGAVQVNINPLCTASELQHQLNDSGSKCIVVFGDALATLAEVVATTRVRHVIVAGRPSTGDALGWDARVPDGIEGAVGLPAALRIGSLLPRHPVQLGGDDLLFLQYAGGTTGESKGAALTHRNLVANTEQLKAFLPQATRECEEVVVTALPLSHIFGLMVSLLTNFSIGAENWLVRNPHDMNALVDTLKLARPTVFVGGNTLYAGLTQHPGLAEVDWSRLRLSGAGGAPVDAAMSARWQAITGSFIREGYGMAETSPVLSINPPSIEAFSGHTGLPLPSTDIKLLDDDGQEVPFGEQGEVSAKGPQVMRGYWQQPEANAAAFTEDGYFRTGDIGRFDKHGFLQVVGRKEDVGRPQPRCAALAPA